MERIAPEVAAMETSSGTDQLGAAPVVVRKRKLVQPLIPFPLVRAEPSMWNGKDQMKNPISRLTLCPVDKYRKQAVFIAHGVFSGRKVRIVTNAGNVPSSIRRQGIAAVAAFIWERHSKRH